MQKKPNNFRQAQHFHPLQLPYVPQAFPKQARLSTNRKQEISPASMQEIFCCSSFFPLIIDRFPCSEKACCLAEIEKVIAHTQAINIKEENLMICAMVIERETGNILFIGVHPRFKQQAVYKALFIKAAQESPKAKTLSLTTYRDKGKADTGYRRISKDLGFNEAEFHVEYGYSIICYPEEQDIRITTLHAISYRLHYEFNRYGLHAEILVALFYTQPQP